MAEQTGPLGETDLGNLKSKLEDLGRAELEIDRAQRAGIEIGSARDDARELRKKMTQILHTYFPGR